MSNNPLKTPCIILSVMSIVSVSAAAVSISANSGLKNELYNAEERLDRANSEISSLWDEVNEAKASADKAAEALSTAVTETPVTEYVPPVTDENTIYIYDNGIDTLEYPQIAGVSLNNFDMTLLQTDGRKHKALYNAAGDKRSRFGIDVSSYQTDIDWEKVKADDVEFAILRAGYRGYETGQLCEDRYFRRNLAGAASVGMDTGVYFFSQALNEAEARAEAEYVIGLIRETEANVTLPIIFDWEFPTDEDPARTDGMTGETQTDCCRAFCDAVRAAGYDTMYYATINTAVFRYDMSRLTDIPIWIAEYSPECHFAYDYGMWQYSCSGVIDGIEGFVDLNIMITG